ncbi:hypothetical protein BC829DRAFT_371233, partial [Chytridium lagenaria]
GGGGDDGKGGGRNNGGGGDGGDDPSSYGRSHIRLPKQGQVCANCGTTATPLWRRGQKNETICNACGLYLKARNTYRPVTLKRRRITIRSYNNTSPTSPNSPTKVSASLSSTSASPAPPSSYQKPIQQKPPQLDSSYNAYQPSDSIPPLSNASSSTPLSDYPRPTPNFTLL